MTSRRSIRKASTQTLWTGASSALPPALPISNQPAGISTISAPDLRGDDFVGAAGGSACWHEAATRRHQQERHASTGRLMMTSHSWSGTQSGSLFDLPSVVIVAHSPVATSPTQMFHPGPVTPHLLGGRAHVELSGPRLNATYLPSGDQSTWYTFIPGPAVTNTLRLTMAGFSA